MSIWFLVWLLLSLTLLYFLAWNLLILYRQKKAWKVYGERRDLRYKSEGFMQSPRLDGVLDGYTIGLFSSEHERENARTNRKLTGIEMQLSSDMPFDGVVASEGMVEIAKSLGFTEEVKPASKVWTSERVAMTENRAAMLAYLTDERIEALQSLMSMKNAWVILGFRNDIFLLRVDTPHALDNPKTVDAVIKRMQKVAAVLELKEGEADTLKNAKVTTEVKTQTIEMSDGDISGLELEDDGDA